MCAGFHQVNVTYFIATTTTTTQSLHGFYGQVQFY